jgi:APA family basic amino acid/polyamine antiporter
MIGVSESARVNAVIVVIKVAVVLVFIGVGYSFINPANYHPFLPPIPVRLARSDSAA